MRVLGVVKELSNDTRYQYEKLVQISRHILNDNLKKILNAIGIKMYLHFRSYFSMEDNMLKDVAKFGRVQAETEIIRCTGNKAELTTQKNIWRANLVSCFK